MRVAVIDSEIEIADALVRHSLQLDWEVRLIDGPIAIEELAAMRLHAVVVDVTLLAETMGCEQWTWLARIAEALPVLAILVCTGPATLHERVRGLTLGEVASLRLEDLDWRAGEIVVRGKGRHRQAHHRHRHHNHSAHRAMSQTRSQPPHRRAGPTTPRASHHFHTPWYRSGTGAPSSHKGHPTPACY
jgi:DNA-binding response OmpR family regulator